MKVLESTYLVIPFEQLKEAKKKAGKLDDGQNALQFDADKKMWFAKPGADLETIAQWRIDPHLASQVEGNPRQDFGDFIRSLGGELKGDPVMDSKTHRVQMSDDKPGSKSGVYVGHLDGFSNGWFADHRNGSERNTWSPRSAKPDLVMAAHRKAAAAQEQHRREVHQKQEQDKRAGELSTQYAQLIQASHDQPYLLKKGVRAAKGVHINSSHQLVIPLSNADGEIRTLQTISADGSKRLSKGGQKEGSFFVVGGTLRNGDPIVLSEGYATAASAAMALRHPVVMTVDSGNLVKVAQALHERYPDSPKLFLGDDDLPKPTRPGNPGKEKATEAALMTGGTYVLPRFTPDELLKGYSDFNDIHVSRGLDALAEQLTPVFSSILHPLQMEQTVMSNESDEPIPVPEALPASFSPVDEYADYGHIADEVMNHEAVHLPGPQPFETPLTEEVDTLSTTNTPLTEPEIAVERPEDMPPRVYPPFVEATPPEPEDTLLAASLSPQPVQPLSATDKTQESTETESDEKAQYENAILIDNVAGDSGRQAKPLDLDALMQQITHELAADGKSVKYLFSGESAFVDHGNRITMANALASQNDAMILTALLVAREQYRGRIELTGTDEFKYRAMTLIAEYNLDVKMKNPQQQLLLDEARKMLKDEPAPGENVQPLGAPVASIVPETAPSSEVTTTTQATKQTHLNTLPPELRPTILPVESPRNASRKESEAGLTGTLLAHGPDNYNFDKSENKSYYVHLRTAQGERYIWGKELANVLPSSGLAQNDVVTLTWLGSKEVSVETKVRDEKGNVRVDSDGVEMVQTINTHRNQWELKPAIDPQVLVRDEKQAAPSATLLAYDMTHFYALQQSVIQLAQQAGVMLPAMPLSADELVWFKPGGEGTTSPATRPANTPLPAQTQDAGTVLMKAMDSENQLKLLLVKGLGDFVQGVVKYQDAYHPVLGKLCTNDNGSRYLLLNAVTSEGVTAIGHGNAINHESGANNAFVFRLNGEKDRLYAPLVEPEKCPPTLHKQLGFTHDYVPPSQTPQRRDVDIVENTAKPVQHPPRPSA
jgi:putative DNA primase/helicase